MSLSRPPRLVVTLLLPLVVIVLTCTQCPAQDAAKKQEPKLGVEAAEAIATTLKTAGAMAKNPNTGSKLTSAGTVVSTVTVVVETGQQLWADINSGEPGAPITAAAHLANTLVAQGGGMAASAATIRIITRRTPLGVATELIVRGATVLAAELVGNQVKDFIKEHLDSSYNDGVKPKVDLLLGGIASGPEDPPMFQGSNEAQGGTPDADMMNNARAVFQTFADAQGDLPEHRDAAYDKIRAMNAKPKGLDYDSEPHTLKYENGAQILGDQRGHPQGPADLSQKGSMLPNRVAEPMVQGVNRAGSAGDGPPAGTGGNGSNAGTTADAPPTNNAAMPGGADAAGNADTSTVRAVMTAVRKRNIQEKIKNAPANRPPGFEQAVSQLLKMAESGPALLQDDALEARIKAGDANAIQFFEFAKGYASGKGTPKEFEAMNRRLNPAR